eukprot:Seg1945.3 transcript_id=Seg1945.3/GoldUCD/mRNA.D3Y31 product="2-oxoglutarate and iron-dependent oxygenase domain-containing protein 2" protein_id=Seg1945.3/GoldUCD/D3Y31
MAANSSKNFICRCAFERNIFLKDLKLHVNFRDEEQFVRDYAQQLVRRGIKVNEFDKIIMNVEQEIERRKSLGIESIKRTQLVSHQYKYIHPHLLNLKEEFLSPEFLRLVALAKCEETSKETLVKLMTSEKAPLSYSFDIFGEPFCEQLIEEIEHFENIGLPKGRPNTMNDYGVLLGELGFNEHFFDPLVMDFVGPIAKILYPEWVEDQLDSHRAFIVGYGKGKDVDLSYHYDDAEVTLNVSLGKEFKGGELYIAGMKNEKDWAEKCYKYSHKKCHGLLHRGQQMHGAMEIEDGERFNLIIWMRSSSIRNKLCPMCNEKPNLIEMPGVDAGFRVKGVDVCSMI